MIPQAARTNAPFNRYRRKQQTPSRREGVRIARSRRSGQSGFRANKGLSLFGRLLGSGLGLSFGVHGGFFGGLNSSLGFVSCGSFGFSGSLGFGSGLGGLVAIAPAAQVAQSLSPGDRDHFSTSDRLSWSSAAMSGLFME